MYYPKATHHDPLQVCSRWFLVRLFPIVLFLMALWSVNLWKFSEWWACLTAVLTATGISWGVFCWFIDPDECAVQQEVGYV